MTKYAVKALEIFCRQLRAEKFSYSRTLSPAFRMWCARYAPKFQEAWFGSLPSRVNSLWVLAERFHGTLQSDCRVLLLSILNSLNIEFLPPMHPIFDWLVRHAAWVHERFRRSRHDGRTAFARRMLREYPSQVVLFGETVIFRDTDLSSAS